MRERERESDVVEEMCPMYRCWMMKEMVSMVLGGDVARIEMWRRFSFKREYMAVI